jgi:transposase
MSTTRRVFPEVFKREAVDRVISSGLSVGKVATELGLNETVLRRWVVRLGGQATEPARRPITQMPAASPSDLAAENARLRRENGEFVIQSSSKGFRGLWEVAAYPLWSSNHCSPSAMQHPQ